MSKRHTIGVLLGCLTLIAWASISTSGQADDCTTVKDCVARVAKIAATMKDSFQGVLAEIVRSELPVGTVITSTLSPDQFLSPINPQFDPDKWIVADGRSLPTGSLYQKLSNESYAPDLRVLSAQRIVMDVVTGDANSGQNVPQLKTPAYASADWAFHFGIRDVAGNRYNNDYEQDVDQFQTLVENEALVVRGRTRNWKHGQWGPWAPGAANYIGIATTKNLLFYYIKIN